MTAKKRRFSKQIEDLIDRITVRLRDAPDGLHEVGAPADPEMLEQSELVSEQAALWAAFDGLNLAQSEVVVWPLSQIDEVTAQLRETDRIDPDDVVIGERGRDLFVLCPDPFLEGADVIMVEEDGERLPHSSTVLHLVLAMFGEISVLYDEDGEFNDELFGEDGELHPVALRRLLRRHLDFDVDAPYARFRLARALADGGELRAAQSELRRVINIAPSFPWPHHELGRLYLRGDGKRAAAHKLFLQAGAALREGSEGELPLQSLDPTRQTLYAYFLAWACLASDDPEARKRLATEVLSLDGGFAMAQEARIRDAVAHGDNETARELLELGLAVLPGHLGLLSLRSSVTG